MNTQEFNTETQDEILKPEDGDVTGEETSEAAGREEPSEDTAATVESAQQEAKEHYDRYLRLSAEFDNFKKRTAREMNEFRKFANETIIKELLPVVDNLERAIASSGDDDHSNSCVVEGVEMTLKAILKVFDQFQVKQIESMGKPFDPLFHQAMMREVSEAYPENTVIKEFQKGYLLHDRLIRPAMVVVSTAKADGPES